MTVAGVRSCSLAPIYRRVRVPVAPSAPVRAVIEGAEPDVVHVQDHFPASRSAARVCAEAGVALVATNHFVPENILPHVPVLPRFRRGRRALERLLWRMVANVFDQAAAVVSPTETAAARLRPHLGAVPTFAISCGTDLARFRRSFADRAADREGARQRFGLSAEDRLFLYVGRLDVEKRVDVLVRAMAEIRCPGVKLLLVGQGRQAGALRRLVRRLGLAGRVVFTGFVPRTALPRIFGCADYFAMAGDVELQSLATLEAMAAGLPVLAAAAGALPELVEDGVNGALFPAGQHAAAAARMRDLITAAHRWPSMSRASVERAGRHSIERTVAAYRRLYADVVRGGPPEEA